MVPGGCRNCVTFSEMRCCGPDGQSRVLFVLADQPWKSTGPTYYAEPAALWPAAAYGRAGSSGVHSSRRPPGTHRSSLLYVTKLGRSHLIDHIPSAEPVPC